MFAGEQTGELLCLNLLFNFCYKGGENMIKHTQVTSMLALGAALLMSSMAYAQGGTTGGGTTGGGTDAGGTGTATDAGTGAGGGTDMGGGTGAGGGTDMGGGTGAGGTDMSGGTGAGGGTDMGGGTGAGGAGMGGGMADTGGAPLLLSLFGSLTAGGAFLLRRKLS
jgi:hypothetical protein